MFLTAASVIALAAAAALSIAFGSRQISVNLLVDALSSTGSADSSLDARIVYERITRTFFSIVSGAALGVSGALMQAVTRNPIADPSILGVNTGASLFVVIGITFFGLSSANQYIVFALIGAGLTAVLVYSISSIGSGGTSPIKLALAGTAVSAALTSLVTAVILPRGQVMDAFRFWQIGSVGAASWDSILLTAPMLVIGLIIAIATAPSLNSLALGDDVATSLGVKTGLLRIVSAFAGVLLCGAITAIAGPIGFIGLMAPHIMRLLLGPDQRILMPMSAVAGAFILTAADVAGRLIARPGEIEVGILTAFVGAPILVIVAMKSKMKVI
jgi:iron complex transport system permease protein